jgi:sn-2 palmitoyl-lipid 9-desaturase
MRTSAERTAAYSIDDADPFATAASVAVGVAPAKPCPVVTPVVAVPAATERWSHGLDWSAVLWIIVVHAGALAAPFVFTWKGLLLFLALSWLTGGLGVCLGYHRVMAHLSLQTYPVVRRFLAILGALAGQGPPITWIGVHRKHHQYTDMPGDPHSPREGAWWSHVLWLFPRPREPQWTKMIRRYSQDLLKDPFMRLLDKTYLLWHLILGAALLAAGWLGWGFFTGLSFLVYGMFLRLVWVMHITWAVNSASHMWGYRNYDTPDDSRNLWWVGLLAYGEGWHNNHHAFSNCARHGHRWWEVDMTYMVIWVMEKLGLAWNVVRKRQSNEGNA